MPAISLALHRISCVMTNPPPEAKKVAQSIVRYAHVHETDGITYGGGGLSNAPTLEGSLYANIDLNKPAPSELSCTADATYGTYDLYAYALTYYGAVVACNVRRIGLEVSCSMHGEAVATDKASQITIVGRTVLTAMGVPPSGPTFIGTDNKSNMLVANKAGSSARSRHFLRLYVMMQQRITRNEIAVGHVPDAQNPSDYLTKWVNRSKFRASNNHLTNARAFVP